MLETSRIPVRVFAAPAKAARLAVVLIAGLALLKFAAHIVTTMLTPYEIHRDEFLYLAMGEHLRLWCMDFPPFIAILAKVARAVLGDNLFAVRFFPAIAGAALVILTGLIAYEFGGGRRAQFVSMLAVLLGPLFLRASALFQPVVWDQLWWTLGFYGATLVTKGAERKGWLFIGISMGLGLLTKFSILFFGLSLVAALLASPQRRVFVTRWPWLAAGLALLLGSPTLVGQVRLSFPVVLHMGDLQEGQLARITYSEFLTGQILMLGPAFLLVAAGWGWLVFSERGRRFRVVALTGTIAFLLLMLLHGKAYYIGPIYPALFAAGAACLENLGGRMGAVSEAAIIALLLLLGAVALPFGLPILPPQPMATYAAKLGLKAAVTTNRGTILKLPQDYADMIGWEGQVKEVARAVNSLPPEKRRRIGLIARNYGEAGALEFYGPRLGLPKSVMLPDNFLLWPPDDTRTTVLTIGIKPPDVARFFKKVEVVVRFDDPWMVDEERDLPICIGEEPRAPISSAWRKRVGWGH